jgi:hypothetical protein
MKGRISTASAKKVNTVRGYPDAASPGGEVDLRRRQFDRAVTTGDPGRAVSEDNVEEVAHCLPLSVKAH